MDPDWFSLQYLSKGSLEQQEAFNILQALRIMEVLQEFSPVLTGSIPLDIALTESDVDICCQANEFQTLAQVLKKNYHQQAGFSLHYKSIRNRPSLIARFACRSRLVEVFAQQQPATCQHAYRHMLAEYFLLQQYGEPLRQKVLSLKKAGYKTEPAFALALNLPGDPYESLLAFCP